MRQLLGLRYCGDCPYLGGLIAQRRLLLVHGVKDGLHNRTDVEIVASKVEKIFAAAGSADYFSLRWGKEGHRVYPELMWPCIAAGLSR